MNVEIGAEAALLPEKEYINGIAVAVWLMFKYLMTTSTLLSSSTLFGEQHEIGLIGANSKT